MAFAASWLQTPLSSSDPDLRELLQRQINLLESRHSDDFAEQVRRVMRSAVLTHHATAAHVADLFSIHQRTLNRRLQDCGTCFRDLLNECRCEIARQLLADSSMSLTEIAAALDYADNSAFARASRRQSGEAPSVWREQYRQRDV